MGVKEKIAQELNNENSIYLLKEGIFWRAYNQSAMRFVNNLKPLKIICKHIKKVKQEIFYCGFPESSLDNIREKAIEKGFQITEINDKKIVISGVSADGQCPVDIGAGMCGQDYKNWMENQKQAHPNPPEGREYQSSSQTGGIAESFSSPLGRLGGAKENDTSNIIRQIQNYPLENATPLETMMFVQKLKQSINEL